MDAAGERVAGTEATAAAARTAARGGRRAAGRLRGGSAGRVRRRRGESGTTGYGARPPDPVLAGPVPGVAGLAASPGRAERGRADDRGARPGLRRHPPVVR